MVCQLLNLFKGYIRYITEFNLAQTSDFYKRAVNGRKELYIYCITYTLSWVNRSGTITEFSYNL